MARAALRRAVPPAALRRIVPRAALRRIVLCLAIATGLSASSPLQSREAGFAPVDIRVSTIENFEPGRTGSTFGALEFRGGVSLRSRDPYFGALSGFDFMPDGSALAVADTSAWFSFRPVDRDGRLVGIEAPRLAPMLDVDGTVVTSKRQGDAEGLRVVSRNGETDAFVSFETRNDVRRFTALPDVSQSRPEPVTLPKAVGGLRRMTGLEAIAAAPAGGVLDGSLVIIAERSLDSHRNHRGWILGGPRRGAFSIARSGDFDVTDAAFLPGGDLLILERFYEFPLKVAFRIRRIDADTLGPGATVDGRILIEADLRYDIDNMEGMALRPGPNGETLIMLCSDDNHSMLQRTMLLQFALPPDAAPIPRPRPVSFN
jgi:hypothetical protein